MSCICSNELFYFKKGLITKGMWKTGTFQLYSNGMIYSDSKKPVNLLKSIPMITCGAQTRLARDRPRLENWMDERLLVCVSYKECKKNLWLQFSDSYQLWYWLHNLGEIVKMSCWNKSISQMCAAYLNAQSQINSEIRKNKTLFKRAKNNKVYF